jgi:PKHD-type hydroxylase
MIQTLKGTDWWEHSPVEDGPMRGYKKNFEHPMGKGHPNAQKALQVVAQTIMNNQVVNAVALVDTLFPPRFNKYDVGCFYDEHCDEPVARDPQGRKVRADYAFTLWLSDPEEYTGGELVVSDGMSDPVSYKEKAGDMLLYPSIHVHKVNEVKTGSRLAIIGWAQSLIPNVSHRAELFRVNRILDEVKKTGDRALFTKLEAHRNHLVRLWSY